MGLAVYYGSRGALKYMEHGRTPLPTLGRVNLNRTIQYFSCVNE